MNFNKILNLIVPKEDKFIILFQESSTNLVEASKLLNELVLTRIKDKNHPDLSFLTKKIKECELKGDDFTHKVFDELNLTFITPFDREDIHKLASELDDILDLIDGTSQRMNLIDPIKMPLNSAEICILLQKQCEEIKKSFDLMNKLSNNLDKVKEHCVIINEYEGDADKLFHNSIQHMFANEKNPIELIKMKDIIINIETATDKAEDVADVIKTILIKNS